MNKVFAHQEFLKGHLLTVVGVMLCLYFSYHIVFGHRSILALNNLNTQIEKTVAKGDIVISEREQLEGMVMAMRPDSMNSDLIEERARVILGYIRADEMQVLSN